MRELSLAQKGLRLLACAAVVLGLRYVVSGVAPEQFLRAAEWVGGIGFMIGGGTILGASLFAKKKPRST